MTRVEKSKNQYFEHGRLLKTLVIKCLILVLLQVVKKGERPTLSALPTDTPEEVLEVIQEGWTADRTLRLAPGQSCSRLERLVPAEMLGTERHLEAQRLEAQRLEIQSLMQAQRLDAERLEAQRLELQRLEGTQRLEALEKIEVACNPLNSEEKTGETMH